MVAFDLYHPPDRRGDILGHRVRFDHHDRDCLDRDRDILDPLFARSIRRAKRSIRGHRSLIADLGLAPQHHGINRRP